MHLPGVRSLRSQLRDLLCQGLPFAPQSLQFSRAQPACAVALCSILLKALVGQLGGGEAGLGLGGGAQRLGRWA